MYAQKTSLILASILFLTFGGFSNAILGRFLPFSGFHPIPRKTPGPIDIEISKVKNITTFPVIVFTNREERGTLKNTGYEAEAFFDNTETSNLIIGGVLGLNVYILQKIRFYWAGSLDEVAANSVSGEPSTPLESYLYYYNAKYGSFRNSLNYRNGLVQLTFRIRVGGSTPNPAFYALEKRFKQIHKAGSTTEFPVRDAFQFYLNVPPIINYYVYPGASLNESTGESHPCTTVIVTGVDRNHFISKQQFEETFLSLRDYNGKPMTNEAKQAPEGRRPIVQSRGIFEIPNNFVKLPTQLGE